MEVTVIIGLLSLLSNEVNCEDLFSKDSDEFKVCKEICRVIIEIKENEERVKEYVKSLDSQALKNILSKLEIFKNEIENNLELDM